MPALPAPLRSPLEALLAAPLVNRTRRNHGLEHATITVLSPRLPGVVMVGRSTPYGFHLYGQVPTEALEAAAHEALGRLRAGEARLALHPNCGTNYVAAGAVAAGAAYLGFFGADDGRARRERLPLVVALTTLALIFAQPLGVELQRHVTTSGTMGSLEIVSVEPRQYGRLAAHFIRTRG